MKIAGPCSGGDAEDERHLAVFHAAGEWSERHRLQLSRKSARLIGPGTRRGKVPQIVLRDPWATRMADLSFISPNKIHLVDSLVAGTPTFSRSELDY